MPYKAQDGKEWTEGHRARVEKRRERDRKSKDTIRKSNKKVYDRGEELVRNKKMSGCVSCGESRMPCLDLHHLNPEENEERQIRRRWKASRLLAELDKCIVLCANCHRIRHCEDGTGIWGARAKQRMVENA